MRKLPGTLMIILLAAFTISLSVNAEQAASGNTDVENSESENDDAEKTEKAEEAEEAKEAIRTDINALIENAKELDGKEVTVQGEAIGERMDRGDYSWVNINDGTNAIGLWIEKSEAEKITCYGTYKFKGDMVHVTGIFYRACSEHGGEADLHGGSVVIAEEGYYVAEKIPFLKKISTAALAACGLVMAAVCLPVIRKRIDR